MSGQTDNFGITRLEQAATGTFGWQVRLQRRGVRFARYFADRSHGGWEESLCAARRWRDEAVRQLSAAEAARVCAPSPRNSSGVVGVTKVPASSPGGTPHQFLQPPWCPRPGGGLVVGSVRVSGWLSAGGGRSIRFSVRRHGDEAAFLLAVQARRAGIGG